MHDDNIDPRELIFPHFKAACYVPLGPLALKIVANHRHSATAWEIREAFRKHYFVCCNLLQTSTPRSVDSIRRIIKENTDGRPDQPFFWRKTTFSEQPLNFSCRCSDVIARDEFCSRTMLHRASLFGYSLFPKEAAKSVRGEWECSGRLFCS